MILTVRDSIRRLHHQLIRLKLLSEHSFGQLTLTDRLLHVRPLSGLVLSSPALLFILWYSGLAVSSHARQSSATNSDEPLTPELFQLHLHDRLTADVRRLLMPEARVRSELPTYNMIVSNDRLAQLDTHLPPDEGKGNYVEAFLQNKSRFYEIEVRYRGTKHWHWNNPQKSWKVRVKTDHLMFEGLPTFNFVNTPDPMPFNEQMVLDIARDSGLLTPAYYPFRLQLNNAYFGVYFFEAQADEGLLRQSERMPGSIYSGAGAPIDPTSQVSTLWASAKNWKKVGATGDKELNDVRELKALLDAIRQDTAQEFAEFAETAIDVDKFATFDALDVVFGNNQHDYHQNHKLYFDPYKNRFEPIATDFRDMDHERQFNRTENPLLLRLKQIPEYLSRRNRKVYELLTGPCSATAIIERTHHWMDVLEPDQSRDPYWDAYELLPVMGTYYRQLVRPMTEERQATAAKMRLNQHGIRVEYLRHELEQLGLSAKVYVPPAQAAPKGRVAGKRGVAPKAPEPAVLDVTVQGPAAFEVTEVVPEFEAGCTPTEWRLYADRDLDQTYSAGNDLRLLAVAAPFKEGKPDITLYPGVSLRPITPNPYRGAVRAEVDPRTYRFFLPSNGCTPTSITLAGRNTATLAKVTVTASRMNGEVPHEPSSCIDEPGFIEPGAKSLHPFCYPLRTHETIHLGPGVVELREPRVYSRYQTLVIEPGTTIRASKDASIIAYGRVLAEGRADAKIRFEPENGHWGGIALQGPDTAGSRLSYIDLIAGTRPERAFFDFPGMLDIHDTKDIKVSFASFSHNEKSDDALHVAYVDGVELQDLTFRDVAADAIDLEHSNAKLARVDIVGAGDDGFDLMGTKAEIVDARVIKCKGNGLSIGERSEVTVARSLLARSSRAMLLKNASSLVATELLTYGNEVCTRVEKESLWYVGTSNLKLDGVHVVSTRQKLDGSPSNISGEFVEQLRDDDLVDLRRDTLQIGEWAALDGALQQLEQRRTP